MYLAVSPFFFSPVTPVYWMGVPHLRSSHIGSTLLETSSQKHSEAHSYEILNPVKLNIKMKLHSTPG